MHSLPQVYSTVYAISYGRYRKRLSIRNGTKGSLALANKLATRNSSIGESSTVTICRTFLVFLRRFSILSQSSFSVSLRKRVGSFPDSMLLRPLNRPTSNIKFRRRGRFFSGEVEISFSGPKVTSRLPVSLSLAYDEIAMLRRASLAPSAISGTIFPHPRISLIPYSRYTSCLLLSPLYCTA